MRNQAFDRIRLFYVLLLCCAVLCCAVLCCAVLCCAVFWTRFEFYVIGSRFGEVAQHQAQGLPGLDTVMHNV